MEHGVQNLASYSANLSAAESRIKDADMAKEMLNLTKLNILSQSSIAMMVQSNQLPQNILSLIK